jgi:hypothetical protein
MSIGKALVEQLRESATGPATGPHTQVEQGNLRIRAELGEYDRFSGTLQSLDVQLDTDAPDDTRAFLSERAARLCQRLSYLEEPLGVWELDGREGLAQLRSTPPQRDGGEIQYWEVTLAAGERPRAQISRYRWAPGMPERELLPYPATFGLLGRLADSIADALGAGRF